MEISMQMNQYYKAETLKSNPKRNLNLHVSQTVSMQITSERKTNFYELLSLNSQNVGLDEIKKAYKNLALRYHPDVCSNPITKEESTRRFIEVRKAYETLSDPNSRRMYDCELGLTIDSFGFGFGSGCYYCAKSTNDRNFPREVWERQLDGLRKRSSERMNKRR